MGIMVLSNIAHRNFHEMSHVVHHALQQNVMMALVADACVCIPQQCPDEDVTSIYGTTQWGNPELQILAGPAN